MKRFILTAALFIGLLPSAAQAQAVIVPSPVPVCTNGDVLQWNTVANNFICTAASAISQPLTDGLGLIRDNVDGTKVLFFQLSGLTTATNRTWTIPNVDLTFPTTLASLGANTYTGLQTFGAGITVTGASTFSGNGTFTGYVATGDGTAAAPAHTFGSALTMGLYNTANRIGFAVAGEGVARLQGSASSAEFYLLKDTANIGFGVALDVIIGRGGAGILTQSNALLTQQFRIGPAAKYLSFNKGDGTSGSISTFDATALYFGTNATDRWYITSAGHFLAAVDNTLDVGANSANRPRHVFTAGDVNVGNHLAFGVNGAIQPAANGVWTFVNQARTDFLRLQFGGTTSAFPALKRSGTEIYFRLADDSGYGAIRALAVQSEIDFRISSKLYINSPSDGIMTVMNNGGTDFNRLQFGGTTSAFPSLQRAGAELYVRLADDSSYANLIAANLFSVKNAIGTTSTDGINIQNNTLSTAIAPVQYSPRLKLRGSGWKTDVTAASQYVDWAIEVRPAQGAAAPTGSLHFMRSINLGAFTDAMSISSSGSLTTSGTASVANLTLTAANGFVEWTGRSVFRSPADGVIKLANNAETDFNRLQFGGTTSAFPAIKRDSTDLAFRLADDSAYTGINASHIYLRGATQVATAGEIRLSHNSSVYARDSANTGNRLILNFGVVATDALVVGNDSHNLRLNTNLATPTTLANGQWWVECTGTSPSRVCAIKVQDGGATRTIGSITY